MNEMSPNRPLMLYNHFFAQILCNLTMRPQLFKLFFLGLLLLNMFILWHLWFLAIWISSATSISKCPLSINLLRLFVFIRTCAWASQMSALLLQIVNEPRSWANKEGESCWNLCPLLKRVSCSCGLMGRVLWKSVCLGGTKWEFDKHRVCSASFQHVGFSWLSLSKIFALKVSRMLYLQNLYFL